MNNTQMPWTNKSQIKGDQNRSTLTEMSKIELAELAVKYRNENLANVDKAMLNAGFSKEDYEKVQKAMLDIKIGYIKAKRDKLLSKQQEKSETIAEIADMFE